MNIAASVVLSSLRVPAFGKPRFSSSLRQASTAQPPVRKWPFPPVPQPDASLGDARKLASNQIVSRRDMLMDVLLVAAWGVAIPAIMWLGAVAGF